MLAGLAVVGGSSSEFFLLQYQRYMLNLFHRQLFCLMDEWFGMTIEEIRVYEEQTRLELDEVQNFPLLKINILTPLFFIGGEFRRRRSVTSLQRRRRTVIPRG